MILYSFYIRLDISSRNQYPSTGGSNDVTYLQKKDKCSPVNYRPISLPSVCCKIVGYAICSQIMKYQNTKNILPETQHVFRESRSTESKLITTVDKYLQPNNEISKYEKYFA